MVLRIASATLAVVMFAGGVDGAVSPQRAARHIPPRVFTADEYVPPKAIGGLEGIDPNFMRRYTDLLGAGATGMLSAPGPGIQMGQTAYDYQQSGSMHHQIEVDVQTGRVHAAWTHWNLIPDSIDQTDRFASYNVWYPDSNAFLAPNDEGLHLSSPNARGGYANLDLASDGSALVAFHQYFDASLTYSPHVAKQATPGVWSNFLLDTLVNPSGEEHLWPKLDVSASTDGDTVDVLHIVTADFEHTDNYAYYRGLRLANGTTIWSLPVRPATGTIVSAVVTEDPTDDDVVIAWSKYRGFNPSQVDNDVVYILSTVDGADWSAGQIPFSPINVTSYGPSSEHRAYVDLAAIFDNSGELHIVWNGRLVDGDTFSLNQCDLLHWSQSTGVITIAEGRYEPGGSSGAWQMNLCKMTIGVGAPGGVQSCIDPSIEDYLYVVYTQFGGPSAEEQEDFSITGFNNGELYLTISRDGGQVWGNPLNLTNTKTPGCNPQSPDYDTCGSEHWASIARAVNDTAHIQYIADLDAGGIPQPEGSWTINPVMYLRLDGNTLCPLIAPVAEVSLSSTVDCEYHTVPGSVNYETLTLENTGNYEMTYEINLSEFTGTGWLSVDGPLLGSIAPGQAPDVRTVTMDAGVLSEGMYTGNVTVTHSDTSQTAFSCDIAFFVITDFICPDEVTLNTSCPKLTVANVNSFGRENPMGGLWRPDTVIYSTGVSDIDTVYGLNPLTDGSLLIARIIDNDTMVYRDVFNNVTPSNPGYRGLMNLTVDSSAYGTFSGSVTASASGTTVDSTLAIDVEYLFPQHPDSCGFVIAKWLISNRTANPIEDLIVGAVSDFDLPAQQGLDNLSDFSALYNLIYQVGADTDFTGQSVIGNPFSAGLTAIQSTPGAGRGGDNVTYVYPSGGFPDGHLYEQMGQAGFAQFGIATDLHSIVAFDQDLDLSNDWDIGFYCLGIVSSITNEADLMAATRKAWRYCFGWHFVPDEVVVGFVNDETVTVSLAANGSHEDGLGGGCAGCQVSIVGGAPAGYSLNESNCRVTLTVDGSVAQPQTITVRVQDLCSQYSDDQVILVRPECDCPSQGDVAPITSSGDGDINVLDVVALIDYVFRSGPSIAQDAYCPNSRGDVAPFATTGDGIVNVIDVIAVIDHVFRSGPAFGDPCVMTMTN